MYGRDTKGVEQLITAINEKNFDNACFVLDRIEDLHIRKTALKQLATLFFGSDDVTIDDLLAFTEREDEVLAVAKQVIAKLEKDEEVLEITHRAAMTLSSATSLIQLYADAFQQVNSIGLILFTAFKEFYLQEIFPAVIKEIIENAGLQKASDIFHHENRELLSLEDRIAILQQFGSVNDFDNIFWVISGEKEIDNIEFYLQSIKASILASDQFSTVNQTIEVLANIEDKRVRRAVAKLLSENKPYPSGYEKSLLERADVLRKEINNFIEINARNNGNGNGNETTALLVANYNAAFFTNVPSYLKKHSTVELSAPRISKTL